MVIRVVKHKEPHTNHDIKSQLAIDTDNIYKNSRNNNKSSCIHVINNHINSRSSSFVDWYLILKVGEDASIATITKQYRKLALLLHPDKNKHPKAEISFKLISQAYKCLSDDSRRSSFNLERWRNQCTECNRIPSPTVSSSGSSHNVNREAGSPSSWKNSRTDEIQQHFRALREQLKEEARVIESCMRLNRAPKNEYPVFDPSRYTNTGYPHRRNQQFSYKNAANPWTVQKEHMALNYDQRNSRCENPIFELRTNYRNLNINSACVSS